MKLFSRKFTTGEKGWVGLVAYIIAVDSVAWANQVRGKRKDETMSVAWGRWLQHPGSRVATGVAWATISLHLFLSWPLPGEKTLKKVVQSMFKKRGVNGEIKTSNLSMRKMRPYYVFRRTSTLER